MKDYYSQYKGSDLWCVKEDNFHKYIQNIRESQFTLGNGLIGTRGVLEEIPEGASPGTFLAGIYDRKTSQVAELVNLPNPFYFKFSVKGEKFGAVAMDILEHHRILNMRDGLLLRRTVYSDVKKRRYDYQSLRFVSMRDKNIGVMQIILTPLDNDAEIELQSGIDAAVFNTGTATEGNKKHFHTIELTQDDYSEFRIVETLEQHQKIIYRNGFYYKLESKKEYAAGHVLTLKLKKNKPAIFTKIFYIGACANEEKEVRKVQKISKRQFNKAFKGRFSTLVKEHVEEWHKLWNISDVVIEGTSDIQKNLRFNIYHMLACAHIDDGYSSIGARTMSGEGYRGHIFWDGEIFLLPFYSYILPDVAKNMLMYRYKRLDQARMIAKEKGYEGAMFPWESAGTGEEETPTWAKNLDGSIIKIKTNDLEHHITADIAFACSQYAAITNDLQFMRDCGYEIIFEAARFWTSRVERNRKGKYEMKDVIGPDEFHEHVNNNAFTNMMAKWNLLEGHKLYSELKKKDNKLCRRLKEKFKLTDKEVNTWKSVALKIVFKMRKDCVIEQFDGFFRKRHIRIKDYDENGIPLLPKGIKVKNYNTTQFVKQADVLMLLYLLPDIANYKTKEKNFWFYVDRTLHKSSLSPSMHALAALEVGSLSHAYQFFNVALRADISNLHGNSHEGMHAASLGGVWQCVVHGFAGVKRNKGMLSVHPNMPRSWRAIRFSLLWQGNVLRVEAKNNEVRIMNESGRKKSVNVRVFDQNHVLTMKKQYVFTNKKIKKQEAYY